MARQDQMVEVVQQLNILDAELRRRRDEINRLTRYYDGDQPLEFASEQYREWFGDQYQGFADNWVAPVADAQSERMRLEGVRPEGEKTTSTKLRKWWEASGAAEEFPLAISRTAVAARSFALVWGSSDPEGVDGDDNDEPQVTFEDPAQAIVAYEPGDRRKRRCGLKLWSDEWTGTDFATFYTPEFLYKFKRSSGSRMDGFGNTSTTASGLIVPAHLASRGGWEPREVRGEPWPLPNPLGEVPLVEFQNKPKLIGEPQSEVSGVISMQDAINALWAYLFTSADYAALPQRVILGAELPKIPILDSNGRVVGHKPLDLPEANIKRILNLEGPNAKIAQWNPASLSIFTEVIEKAANHIGNQTRTPLYYFASSIQNISGDTLKALETGLNSKVLDRIEVANGPTRTVYRLMAKAAGDEALAKSVGAGTIVWKDHESRSETQKVDGLQKLKDMCFPLEYLVEKYTGGEADEVERIMDMLMDELANYPLLAMVKQDQVGPDGEPLPGSRMDARPDAPKRAPAPKPKADAA